MRIYRKLYSGVPGETEAVGLLDQLTGRTVPIDPSNRDYTTFLALGNRALTLDFGEALPDGVTATDERVRIKAAAKVVVEPPPQPPTPPPPSEGGMP